MTLLGENNQSLPAISIFWFRRDLRLDDNTGFSAACNQNFPVLPLFIFDTNILLKLQDKDDARVQFIYERIILLTEELIKMGSSLVVEYGDPVAIFNQLKSKFNIKAVFANHDYEPYAIQRDIQVNELLQKNHINLYTYKDQVIFEKREILNISGKPFQVFTPYMKKWKVDLRCFTEGIKTHTSNLKNLFSLPPQKIPTLKEIGFEPSAIKVSAIPQVEEVIQKYHLYRDFPAIPGTSRIGVHLRFGTVSIRKMVKLALLHNEIFLNELIWREFYMMILYNFPFVATKSFKSAYDQINWLNNEGQFKKWCEGNTGYPLVDAGMRELNATGFMHNRVRMVVASFLTKHLLIDWRWGEAFFANKLLDYEMASNNGGWQWAAGTGTDAQPYFRVFNPMNQLDKFDKQKDYILRWIPELNTAAYPQPIVDHKFARERALKVYGAAVKKLP